MKPVLMIHEFREEFFDLPLEDFTLTFDDGLASVIPFLDRLKTLNTEKIFFISTDIVCPECTFQDTSYITCTEAHRKAFKGDFSNYMKWSQIQKIHESTNMFIGGHSHKHKEHSGSLRQNYLTIEADTDKMIEEFQKRFIHIDHFCYPYNKDYPLYEGIVKRYHVKHFYGNERIDIKDII